MNKEVNGIDGLPTLSTGMEMALFKARSRDVPDLITTNLYLVHHNNVQEV